MHAAIVLMKMFNRNSFGNANIKANVVSVRVVEINGPDIDKLF